MIERFLTWYRSADQVDRLTVWLTPVVFSVAILVGIFLQPGWWFGGVK